MIRKITKKSSKTRFLLYAVIWGLFIPVFVGVRPYASAEEVPPGVESVIRSLDDPFDVQVRAPEIVELFLSGLAEIKKQVEMQEKPPEEKVVEPAVPVVQPIPVPVAPEPKKLELPEMKVSGIIYDTDKPQAIINGKVVGIGSDINGVLITGIQKGRIDARYDGVDISLKFNNE